jgi:hypothetical protein
MHDTIDKYFSHVINNKKPKHYYCNKPLEKEKHEDFFIEGLKTWQMKYLKAE